MPSPTGAYGWKVKPLSLISSPPSQLLLLHILQRRQLWWRTGNEAIYLLWLCTSHDCLTTPTMYLITEPLFDLFSYINNPSLRYVSSCTPYTRSIPVIHTHTHTRMHARTHTHAHTTHTTHTQWRCTNIWGWTAFLCSPSGDVCPESRSEDNVRLWTVGRVKEQGGVDMPSFVYHSVNTNQGFGWGGTLGNSLQKPIFFSKPLRWPLSMQVSQHVIKNWTEAMKMAQEWVTEERSFMFDNSHKFTWASWFYCQSHGHIS